MIQARGISVLAGGRALLREISLEVRQGEVLAVIGPNGAGKSTLLRALAGELRPTSGEVRWAGGPGDALSLARRRAVVSQSVELAFPMTAWAVAMLGRLPWHGTTQAGRDEPAVWSALERAGVSHFAGRAYATLSGGERQRVQLARALAQLDGAPGPVAILLDEPTASLDAAHRLAILTLLRKMAGEGVAVLVILHDINEAAFVADRVAILENGRLAALGATPDVLNERDLSDIFGISIRRTLGWGVL